MHGKIATCLCALVLTMPAWAQSAIDPTAAASAPLPANAIRLGAMTVSGRQPGPELWKVSKGDHVLWVLGTLTPLPKHMQWQSTQIEYVIARSQELLEPPAADLEMKPGVFSRLALRPSARKNPDGATLQQILPPAMFARWQVLKHQYLGNRNSLEYWRPMLVAAKLYDKALDSADLTNKSDVADIAMRLAHEHDVSSTPVEYVVVVDPPRDMTKAIATNNQQDILCFDQTMNTIEHHLGALTMRANAWATGDMRALRNLSSSAPYEPCIVAAINGDFERQLGLTDLPERIEATWLSAAEAALARNRETVALLSMEQVLSPDGYLAKLKAMGYTVQSPDGQGS